MLLQNQVFPEGNHDATEKDKQCTLLVNCHLPAQLQPSAFPVLAYLLLTRSYWEPTRIQEYIRFQDLVYRDRESACCTSEHLCKKAKRSPTPLVLEVSQCWGDENKAPWGLLVS